MNKNLRKKAAQYLIKSATEALVDQAANQIYKDMLDSEKSSEARILFCSECGVRPESGGEIGASCPEDNCSGLLTSISRKAAANLK